MSTEEDRKFQTTSLFLFFLLGLMGSLLTSSIMAFLKGEGLGSIFWLLPFTVGSIMTIIGIVLYYLEMKRPMEIMGEQAKNAIDNFMKAFPEYEIEHVVANLEVKPTKVKGKLEIKIKKNAEKLKHTKNQSD